MPRALEAATRARGEMQAGGRRRHRALLAREHRLVVGAVRLVGAAAAGDIGRQRHVAALGQRLIEHRAMEREGKRHLAALPLGLDRGVELVEEAHPAFAAEAHDVTDGEALTGRTSAASASRRAA